MNRAYVIKPDAAWDRSCGLDASHSAGLPGVICSSCGTWATTGIQYPSIDVAAIQREVGKLEPWPVSLAEFADLKSRVERFFAPEQEIRPGTCLGPIKGKGRGKFGDFAWLNPWTVLVQEVVANRLERAHIHVVGVKCHLDFKVGREESLFEIEALPAVRLAQHLVPREYELCGRIGITAPETIILNADSYDDARPIQRIYELPTYIVVNSKFADFITEDRLTDIILNQVAFE